MIFLLLSCTTPPTKTEETPQAVAEESDDTLQSLEAPRLLRRMSLDLRGTLPTLEELDAVEADPSTLDGFRDQYLEDPRFEDRLVDVLAKQWHTEVETFIVFYFEWPELDGDETNEYAYERSIGDEPLRLISRVVVEDQPWEQIVTADWTMATDTMAKIFPLEWEEGATGWRQTRYTDGRPAAGVLATNGLWWRYYTTLQNLNRGRAAAITRLLLCEDMLSRPINLSGNIDAINSGNLSDAIRENPYCQGCHTTLDPLAANLFGFVVSVEQSGVEMAYYHPEREHYGADALGVTPAWFGQPTSGLAQLGMVIAEDPRFWRCSAQRAAEAYWQRPVTAADFDRIESFRQVLVKDHSYKNLLRAVTDSAVYRAERPTENAPTSQWERERVLRLMDPALVNSMLVDLTDFHWTYQGFEQLKADEYGYRVLGGGVDGVYNTQPLELPTVTWSLMMRRASEAAARLVVEKELEEEAAERKLFDAVTLSTQAGSAEFRAEIERLHWRLYARRADPARVDSLEALWSDVAALSDPSTAWTALLATMMRDPDFVSY
jgi:hypothetical protein